MLKLVKNPKFTKRKPMTPQEKRDAFAEFYKLANKFPLELTWAKATLSSVSNPEATADKSPELKVKSIPVCPAVSETVEIITLPPPLPKELPVVKNLPPLGSYITCLRLELLVFSNYANKNPLALILPEPN